MRPDNPVRRVFRAVSVSVLMFIGAVLFLFPEPFTSVLGMVLILVALLWVIWSRTVVQTDSDSDLVTR